MKYDGPILIIWHEQIEKEIGIRLTMIARIFQSLELLITGLQIRAEEKQNTSCIFYTSGEVWEEKHLSSQQRLSQ